MNGHYLVLSGALTSVQTVFAVFPCCIPVLPGGGGEDQPLLERTEQCRHPTTTLVGSAPTCDHHLTLVAEIGGIDRFELLRDLQPMACP